MSIVLLPYAASSVAAARWHLRAGLGEAGIVGQAVGDAMLVVSELLSNALLHARPLPGSRVQMFWALAGGAVQVAVSDGGSTTWPRPTRPSLSALGGRGLAIVEHLSSRWGVRASDTGTTVWAVLPAPVAAGGPGPPGGRHEQRLTPALRHDR